MKVIAACVVSALMATAGCGSNDAGDVSAQAVGFYQAVAEQDGAAACARLAPETTHQLEQSAQAPCASAVLDEDIPEVGDVQSVDRFGNQAQVRFRGDVAFLAEFPGGWKVVAVSCTPRPPLPHDCQVKG